MFAFDYSLEQTAKHIKDVEVWNMYKGSPYIIFFL